MVFRGTMTIVPCSEALILHAMSFLLRHLTAWIPQVTRMASEAAPVSLPCHGAVQLAVKCLPARFSSRLLHFLVTKPPILFERRWRFSSSQEASTNMQPCRATTRTQER